MLGHPAWLARGAPPDAGSRANDRPQTGAVSLPTDSRSNVRDLRRLPFLGGLLVFVFGVSPVVAPALQTHSAPPAQAERVAVGDQAIDFSLESIDGESYRLSDLRGEKNAIVVFFRGTW